MRVLALLAFTFTFTANSYETIQTQTPNAWVDGTSTTDLIGSEGTYMARWEAHIAQPMWYKPTVYLLYLIDNAASCKVDSNNPFKSDVVIFTLNFQDVRMRAKCEQDLSIHPLPFLEIYPFFGEDAEYMASVFTFGGDISAKYDGQHFQISSEGYIAQYNLALEESIATGNYKPSDTAKPPKTPTLSARPTTPTNQPTETGTKTAADSVQLSWDLEEWSAAASMDDPNSSEFTIMLVGYGPDLVGYGRDIDDKLRLRIDISRMYGPLCSDEQAKNTDRVLEYKALKPASYRMSVGNVWMNMDMLCMSSRDGAHSLLLMPKQKTDEQKIHDMFIKYQAVPFQFKGQLYYITSEGYRAVWKQVRPMLRR